MERAADFSVFVAHGSFLFDSVPESVRWINTKYPQSIRLRDEFQLLKRQFEPAQLRVALHIRIELRRGKAAADHVTFELGHVDTVRGKSAQCFVQRSGYIAHLKYKSGHHPFFGAARPFRFAR